MDEKKKYFTWVGIAVIFTLGWVLSAFILTGGMAKIKGDSNVIEVKGSAKKQLKSDLAIWTGGFSAQRPDVKEAYKEVQNSAGKIKNYLLKMGVKEDQMVFSAVSTNTIYELTPNGMTTSKVDSYRLTQSVEVKSTDVDKISNISRKITELINQQVNIDSSIPSYYYTKLADLKLDMLALATKDAQLRAEKIAENTGGKIGTLKSADMGVFQITPPYSTDISGDGMNDTSSIEKEITAVVNCNFNISQ